MVVDRRHLGAGADIARHRHRVAGGRLRPVAEYRGRHAGHLGQHLERAVVGRKGALFPAMHGRLGDVQLGGEFLLGETVLLAQGLDSLSEFGKRFAHGCYPSWGFTAL